MPQLFVLAQISTGHFDFEVLAKDEEQAERLLLKAWRRHCRDYATADRDLMERALIDGDVRFTEITPGHVLRDGSKITL